MLTFDQALNLTCILASILACWVIVATVIALFVGRVARLGDAHARREAEHCRSSL